MAIGITDHTGPYVANGSQAVFPFDFTAMSDGEVAVSVNGTVISSTLYMVERTDTGGSVAFLSAPATGASILILANPDFSQLSEFENQGAYNLSTINAINRRSAVKDAWLASTASRALTAPLGETDPLEYFRAIGFKGDEGDKGDPGDISNTIILSGITTTSLINPRDVYPVGDLCYVTNNGNSSITIYDTSTSTPTLLSDTAQSGLLQFRSLVVAGEYLFTTVQGTNVSPGTSFAVFNVKNPSAPTFVVNKASANLWRPACCVLSGNILLVSGVSQPGVAPIILQGAKMVAFDVTDPANPVELGSWATPDTFSISKFSVYDNRFYIATSDPFGVSTSNNFYVVDFSNPAAMTLVGTLVLPPIGGAGQGAADVIYNDGYCYMSCEGIGGFTIVDVNQPTAPVQVVHQSIPAISGGSNLESTGIAVFGNTVVVSDLLNSVFYVYDVTNKATPVLLNSGSQALSTPGRMVTEGRNTFIANRGQFGPAGLGIQNLGGPALSTADIGSLSVTSLRAGGLSSLSRTIVHDTLNVGGNAWFAGRLGLTGPLSSIGGQTFKGGTKVYCAGANATDVVADGNPAGVRVLSYGATSSIISGGVAAGTETAPTIPLTNALVAYRFNYWNATQFARFSEIQGVLIEPTPSATASGGRLLFRINALGSAAQTEVVRMDVATGLSMFGANPVIDQNRMPVLRSFTKAQLLALTPVSSFSLAWCSDASGGACPAFYNGSAWQKMSFTAL